jgi:hypothetical protein
MDLTIWGTVATKMAGTLRRIQPLRPQGVILVHHADEDHLTIWLYDADVSGAEESVRCELGLLRQRLKQIGVEELGLGLSQDGQCWALVARAGLQSFQTNAGKMFCQELLVEDLSGAMREAWVGANLLSGVDLEEACASK